MLKQILYITILFMISVLSIHAQKTNYFSRDAITGEFAYVDEVMENSAVFLAVLQYDLRSEEAYPNGYFTTHNNLKYFIIDKGSKHIKDSIIFHQTLDSTYWHANVREENDSIHIYYHINMPHSSSWRRDILMHIGIDPSGNIFDHSQKIDQVETPFLVLVKNYYFERGGVTHQIYTSFFYGKSNYLLAHKTFDSQGNELSYRRLNPFGRDSFETPLLSEFYDEIQEIDGNFFIYTHNMDTLSPDFDQTAGYSKYRYMFHYDSVLDFKQSIMLWADSVAYNSFNCKPNEWYYNYNLKPRPILLDYDNSRYTYAGKAWITLMNHNCSNQKWHGATLLTQIKSSDTLAPSIINRYSDTSQAYLDTGDYISSSVIPPIKYGIHDYDRIRRGGSHRGQDYILHMDDPVLIPSWDTALINTIIIQRVDTSFHRLSKSTLMDSVYNLHCKGAIQSQNGELLVYGTCYDRSDTARRYASRPYLVLLDKDGHPLSIYNGENTIVSSEVVLYPNPGQDYIKISEDEKLLGADYELYDMQGKLLSQGIYQGQIPTGSLMDGSYFIRLHKDSKRYHAKWQKLGG